MYLPVSLTIESRLKWEPRISLNSSFWAEVLVSLMSGSSTTKPLSEEKNNYKLNTNLCLYDYFNIPSISVLIFLLCSFIIESNKLSDSKISLSVSFSFVEGISFFYKNC